MSQFPQQQQQQQQQQCDINSNSNCNVIQPHAEELEALLATDIDTWLATLPCPEQCHTSLTEDLHTTTETQQPSAVTVWTRLQDKAFENALLACPEGTENRWGRIAALVPGGKTPAQVKERLEELLHDTSQIESGRYDDLMEAAAAEIAAAEEMAAASMVDGGRTEHTPPVNGNGRTTWTGGTQVISRWAQTIWRGKVGKYFKTFC